MKGGEGEGVKENRGDLERIKNFLNLSPALLNILP